MVCDCSKDFTFRPVGREDETPKNNWNLISGFRKCNVRMRTNKEIGVESPQTREKFTYGHVCVWEEVWGWTGELTETNRK